MTLDEKERVNRESREDTVVIACSNLKHGRRRRKN